MFVERQTAVDRHTETLHASSYADSCFSERHGWDLVLTPQPRTGSEKDCFRLLRIERQSVLGEPRINSVSTILQYFNGFVFVQCDVQLCVIGILKMTDPMWCDDVCDRCTVECEKERSENRTLRNAKLAEYLSGLISVHSYKLRPVCQVRLDPAECRPHYTESVLETANECADVQCVESRW